MTEAEKLQRRAEKFGTKNDELKKAERAERFGVVLSSSSTSVSAKEIKANDVNVDPETLKRRAERFGEVTNSKLAKIEDSEKKSERAKRFGVPNSDPSAETAAKEARAERFKTQLGKGEILMFSLFTICFPLETTPKRLPLTYIYIYGLTT